MPQDAAPTRPAPNKNRAVVRALSEQDLPEATRIVRLAFGTFFGAPDPENFWSDRDYVYGRHRAPHVASFAATIAGKLVGSNFATSWGSVGFLGPVTVHPDIRRAASARPCSPAQWRNSTRGA